MCAARRRQCRLAAAAVAAGGWRGAGPVPSVTAGCAGSGAGGEQVRAGAGLEVCPGGPAGVLVKRKELGLVACSFPSAAARRFGSSEEETKRRRGWEWPGAALQPFWKYLLVSHPRRVVINRTEGGGATCGVPRVRLEPPGEAGGAAGRGRRKRSPPCPVCFSPPCVAFLAEGLPMS